MTDPGSCRLRVVFMGTPDFAVPTLAALIGRHEVVRVYSQPPRPAGRGFKERRSPVHEAADRAGLTVRTPASLKDEATRAEFVALAPDVAVVAAYGLILPRPVLDAPRLGCVNVHASLLPRWRGAAPIHRAIMAGDAETGVTIMQMEAGLDTGPMLLARAVPIGPKDTTGALHDRLADLGASLLIEALDGLAAGTLTARPQPAGGVTYASKIGNDTGAIDWTRPAADVSALIRGLSPWPGAGFVHAGHRLKVLMATAGDEDGGEGEGHVGAAPGTVLDDRLTVACGRGSVRLLRLQRPGKAALPAADFLRGYPLPPGTVLS